MMAELASLHILIIEDDSYTRDMLCHLLNIMGIKQIYQAENGREGLNILENPDIKINAVLCDWNMPCLTGIDLLREVRRGKNRDLIFLIISGRMDSDSVLLAKQSGVSDYLRKPISPAQLQTKLQQAIRRDSDFIQT